MKSLIITSFFILQIHYIACKKYYNHTLLRVIPINDEQLTFFKNLSQNYQVDYWKPPGMANNLIEFLVKPEDRQDFMQRALEGGLYLTTIIDDVQSQFDKQTIKTYIRRKMDSFDWSNFFRLNDIYGWLKDLKKMYPKEVNITKIGKSHEDRGIYAVKVVLGTNKKRSAIVLESGIHSREWISPAFVTYVLNEIIHAQKSGDKELADIAKMYTWYFVPVINPDGYEYSHTEDRLWRKNRRNGHGVDLNRNFQIAFGTAGVSFNKNSQTYCGHAAFSEPETKSMANFLRSINEPLEYYLAFHSYGQYMIIPYTHTKIHYDNYEEVKNMCNKAARNVFEKRGVRYQVGTAFDTVGYMTSGVSGCWAKKTFGIPYVVTFELPDDGRNGFALPTHEILPTCQDTMDALRTLLIPQTLKYKKLNVMEQSYARESTFLDKIVLVFNILLFIIVRFD